MSFDRVVSVNLFVEPNDLASCRNWWEDGIGLPLGRTTDEAVTFFLGENTLLNLHAALGDNSRLAGRASGVSLRVPSEGDLARLITRLRGRGVAIGDSQLKPFLSGHRLVLSDPAGNSFALVEVPELEDQPHMFEAPAAVAIGVSRLRRALDFYVAQLEVPMLDQLGPSTARLMVDGTQIFLVERPDASPAPAVRGETGICLGVTDPAYVFGQLEGRGIRFAEAPVTVGSTMLAAVRDPDGNTLTLMGAI